MLRLWRLSTGGSKILPEKGVNTVKIFNIEQVKNHICDLLGDTVNVNVNIPKVETHFVMIPPMDESKLVGGIGKAVQSVLKKDDTFPIPTEVGNGVIVNLKEWLDNAWEVWGMSASGKFLMYKPGEFHILTMEELGEYLCESSGCESVGYSPSESTLGFEIIVDKDYDTELGEIISRITAETAGEDATPSTEVMSNLKKKANRIIWGDSDVFVCPTDGKLYVFGSQFQDFLDNFQDMADVICAESEGNPMEEAIKGCLDDISDLVEKKDIKVLGTDVAESIEMLRDIVSEGKAGAAIEAMASMLLD